MSEQAQQTAKVIQPKDVKWEAHPRFRGVESAYLLSQRNDGSGITYALTHWSVGARFETHIHERSDDIIYVFKGRATIWIDGLGDVALEAGSFVNIPRGVAHLPHDVEEDTIAQHTWFPATI